MASKPKYITLTSANNKWTVLPTQVSLETIALLCGRKPAYLKVEYNNKVVFPNSIGVFENLLDAGISFLICFGMLHFKVHVFICSDELSPVEKIDSSRAQAASTLTNHIFKPYRYPLSNIKI